MYSYDKFTSANNFSIANLSAKLVKDDLEQEDSD